MFGGNWYLHLVLEKQDKERKMVHDIWKEVREWDYRRTSGNQRL